MGKASRMGVVRDEKAAETEVKCIRGVELEERVDRKEEKKTDFELRKELEKRDDETLAEKQKSGSRKG